MENIKKQVNLEETYDFVRINEDNISDMIKLLKLVANKNYAIDYFKKKYCSPRSFGQYNGFLAYEKKSGKIVSMSSSLPFYLKTESNEIVPTTQLMETFTMVEHRGRGLMTKMTKMIIEEEISKGTLLFFGLMNQNNVHGFTKKLDFKLLTTMKRCTIEIKTIPLEAGLRRLGLSPIYQWFAKSMIQSYLLTNVETIENSVNHEGGSGILHDKAFYDYKTFTFNHWLLIGGLQTWIKMETGLLVGDVIIPKDINIQSFSFWLESLKKMARNLGLRQIIFQFHPNSRLAEKMEQLISCHKSWSICTFSPDTINHDQFKNLRFTYADFDTF